MQGCNCNKNPQCISPDDCKHYKEEEEVYTKPVCTICADLLDSDNYCPNCDYGVVVEGAKVPIPTKEIPEDKLFDCVACESKIEADEHHINYHCPEDGMPKVICKACAERVSNGSKNYYTAYHQFEEYYK